MPEADSAIARKHIDISIRTKLIAALDNLDNCVYLATYTIGDSGQSYQHIEEQSGEEFWSIKAYTPAPHLRLKDPEVNASGNIASASTTNGEFALSGQRIKPET